MDRRSPLALSSYDRVRPDLIRRILRKVVRMMRQASELPSSARTELHFQASDAAERPATALPLTAGISSIAPPSEQRREVEQVRVLAGRSEVDRLRLRSDAIEKRLDLMEGWARVSAERTTFVESMVSDVDGFRMARARQIASQQRMAEKFVTSVSGLVDQIADLASELAETKKRIVGLDENYDERIEGLSRQLTLLSQAREQFDRGTSEWLQSIPSKGHPDGLQISTPADPHHSFISTSISALELDDLYLRFENEARGTRETIAEKQSIYLPLVPLIDAGTSERPILDLGAGRGEWLELLRQHGFEARGVDKSQAMVEFCQSLSLNCVQADALATLQTLPDRSIGLLTGFHIIEHIPYETFIALLDECLRVLAPGGAVLFETPDPQNVLVGSHTFYKDPTHRHPMPSTMVKIIAEARGFQNIEIRRVNPSEGSFRGNDQQLISELNELFYGAQDYAMIGYKI